MYIQTNTINIGMKLNLLHKKKPTTQAEEAFDLQKFTSLQAFKEYVIEKYFKLETILQQHTHQESSLADQKDAMVLIVKVQKDWLNNNNKESKPNKFKRIKSEEDWNQVVQSVLLTHTKEQSMVVHNVGENATPKPIVVEFKLKCKPAKRMIKKQLKELKKQKKQIKKQFVSLKEETSQHPIIENMYPTLQVPAEEEEAVNYPQASSPLKVKRELLLEKKLKLQEMRAKIKMTKLEANVGEDNREKVEKKLEKCQAKLERKKERLEKKETNKTEKLIKKQEKREQKLREKELKLEQAKDDIQLFGENGQALVLKPEIKRIFIDGNNMFFMNRTMRHILLELKNRKLAEDLIATTSKMYSQISELLWNQQLQLMQVCFDSSSQQVVINNPNVTFVVTSAKQEGFDIADDLLVDLANRQNIACYLDSCLFVTSDRVLRQRLRSIGNGAKVISSGNWMKFIYSHLCANTNELSMDDWLLQILNGLNH